LFFNTLAAATSEDEAITFTATGPDGSTSEFSQALTSNTPPVADIGGPYVGFEGISLALDGTGSSDPDQASESLTYEWDLDYDGVTFDVDDDATGSQLALTFFDDVLARQIGLRVTDDGGLTNIATTTLEIQNVAPQVTDESVPLIFVSVDQNGVASLTGSFSDPGTDDTHTVEIDWGDGQSTTIVLPQGERTFAAQITYAANATGTPINYLVQATVTDDDGGSGIASRTVTIDPAGLDYGDAPDGPPSGLTSGWSGDAVAGTTVLDAVGGNDGVMFGGVTITPGQVGQALQFDGVNDYVDFGDVFNFERTDTFSFGFWLKQEPTVSDFNFVLAKQSNGNPQGNLNGQGYAITMSSTGQVQFRLINNQIGGVSNWLGVNGSTNIRNGQFRYVAVTYDGSSTAAGVRIYIDGVEESLTVVSDTLSASTVTNETLRLGAREGATFGLLDGVLDEVQVYDRALTGEEIAAIANGTPSYNTLAANNGPSWPAARCQRRSRRRHAAERGGQRR